MDPPGFAVRLKVWPAHIVELFVATGAAGIGLTVTLVTPSELVHPKTVCVTE